MIVYVFVCLFFQSKLLNKGYLLVYTPQSTENLLWKLILENDSLTLVTLSKKVKNKRKKQRNKETKKENVTGIIKK